MRYLTILSVFLTFLFFSAPARAAEMVYPNPDIAPAEVIAIQLNGLQYNDSPQIDAGIRQTWAFAHPRNRAMTGPLNRFANMLKGPGYDMLLYHASHQIVPANSGDGWRQFDVFMESGNGKLLQFAWIVEKVTEGQYKDCWMTVAVSAPRSAGHGS